MMNARPNSQPKRQGADGRTSSPVAPVFIKAPRKTLGLTGITLKTVTLMAPGALLWVMFPLQAANTGGAGAMWPGVVLALAVALVSAGCYAWLARQFPNAGGQGSYFFAEKAFLDRERGTHPRVIRAAKLATGWAAHLYYWLYPGVLAALLNGLLVSLLGGFGVEVLLPGRILLAALILLLAAMLAGRGISGSSLAAVVANLMQMLMLLIVVGAAFVFRAQNPLGIVLWEYGAPESVLLPASAGGLFFQAALAILILAGFESSTSLAVEALQPQRDIPRGTLLSLVLQGLLVYLLGYAGLNLAVGDRLTATDAAGEIRTGLAAVAGSGSGLGILAQQLGDALLGGNGFALMLVITAVCGLVLFGLLLAAINMGVRVSFLMAQDREMPGVLGMLHDDFATPYAAVWILTGVSMVVAALGVIDLTWLSGFILAAGTGVFLLYALICGMALVAMRKERVKPQFIPWFAAVGIAVNLALIVAWPVIGLSGPGFSRSAVEVGAGAVLLWGILGAGLFLLARRRRFVQGRRPSYQDEEIRLRHRQVYRRHLRGESFASIGRTMFISEQRVRDIFNRYVSWRKQQGGGEDGEDSLDPAVEGGTRAGRS